MPTGVALSDPRQQLFAAAERILRRDGPHALTSRAVTTEADVAKGVLHRHFPDFDAFLAELVLDRLDRLKEQAAALLDTAGNGNVVDNLTNALTEMFGPTALAIVGLIVARDDLRTRLRAAGTARVPLLGEATAMIAAYLCAECTAGRITADAMIETLAPTLVGAAHLLLTESEGPSPAAAVRMSVMAIIEPVQNPTPS